MIGRLTGRIVEEEPDGTLVLDVGGVGYEVAAPPGTSARAAHAGGVGTATLFVHTHVREDALLLYGFATRDDRAAFRTLIGISNVGPRMAMAILGAMSAAELGTALARRDVARLTAIPGIGKKTAERLLVELKDKLPAFGASAVPAAGSGPERGAAAGAGAPHGSKEELLQGALTRMGFRPAEAERAIAALAGRIEAAPLGELVREALALLS